MEEDKEWLREAGAQLVHIRATTADNIEGLEDTDPVPGFDVSLADKKGFFTKWAWEVRCPSLPLHPSVLLSQRRHPLRAMNPARHLMSARCHTARAPPPQDRGWRR